VNSLNNSVFGLPLWVVLAAVAIAAGFVLVKIFASKKNPSAAKQRRKKSSDGSVKDFMSTMRLSDTQRIDRLQRVVTLKIGEKADLKDLSFDRLKKFVVTFGGLEQTRGQDRARIKLELGGAIADCGAFVTELEDNEFLVPRASDDQRCSIHYSSGSDDAVGFLQIKVNKIDPVDGSVALDVLHLRGRQAA